MDKKILLHSNFIKLQISKFEKELSDTKKDDEKNLIYERINNLSDYHNDTIRYFQHERLIHLIVTIFFAGLLFIAIAGLLISASTPLYYGNTNLLTILAALIVVILFITEIFYIRYYFQLENGTQSLYKYTEKLYQMSHIDE